MGTASFFVFLVREISVGKNKKDIVDSGKKLQKKRDYRLTVSFDFI
jgi:hypothetical protein